MDDQRPPERKAKRGRDEDDVDVHAASPPDFPFEEAAGALGGDVVGEASRRPPGVFQLPWQKCRGGLGLHLQGASSSAAGAGSSSSSSPSWELRDVFFRSLVDGGAAAIGVPGDRLVSPPPSRRALLDGVDAWLAAAADGDGDGDGEEVDPVWRSALAHDPRRGGARARMDDGRSGPAPRMLRG